MGQKKRRGEEMGIGNGEGWLKEGEKTRRIGKEGRKNRRENTKRNKY